MSSFDTVMQDPQLPPQGRQPMFPPFEPEERDPVFEAALPAFQERLRRRALQADGLEFFGWQTVNAVKTFADSAAQIVPLGAGLGGAAWEAGKAAIEGRFSDIGPAAARGFSSYRDQLNTSLGGSTNVLDYVDRRLGTDYDRTLEKEIDAKLGKDRIWSDTIGHLSSFVVGPGAAIGRASAQATAAATTILAEKALARAIVKGRLNRDGVDSLLAQGQFWNWVAKSPEFRQGILANQNYLAYIGKTVPQLMSATAANVAQSYALSRPKDADAAALSALYWSWAAVPLANMGTRLKDAVLRSGMSDDVVMGVRGVLDEMDSGKISIKDAMKKVQDLHPSPAWKQLAAGAIASSFEGTAFTMIDPAGQKAFQGFLAGDPDATRQFMASLGGNVIATLLGKHALKDADLPLIRSIRPDLVNLREWIDAEAVKRVGNRPQEPEGQATIEGVAPEVPPPGEGEAGFVGPETSERYIARETKSLKEQIKQLKSFEQLERMRAELARLKGEETGTPEEQEKKRLKGEIKSLESRGELEKLRERVAKLREKYGVEMPPEAAAEVESVKQELTKQAEGLPDQPVAEQPAEEVNPIQQEVEALQADHLWSQPWVDPLMQAGLRPDATVENRSGKRTTWLRLGPADGSADNLVGLVQDGDGQPTVVMSNRVANELEAMGVKLEGLQQGNIRQFSGEQSKIALDAVSVYSVLRQLQAVTHYERLGFREVPSQDGVLYRDEETGRYYRPGLDGKDYYSTLPDQTPDGSEELATVGRPDDEAIPVPGLPELAQYMLQKAAIAPEPLVDATINQALVIASQSEGRMGSMLRDFLSRFPPNPDGTVNQSLQGILNNPELIDVLAYELGRLGTGNGNAEVSLANLRNAIAKVNQQQGTDIQFPQADRLPGYRRVSLAEKLAAAAIPLSGADGGSFLDMVTSDPALTGAVALGVGLLANKKVRRKAGELLRRGGTKAYETISGKYSETLAKYGSRDLSDRGRRAQANSAGYLGKVQPAAIKLETALGKSKGMDELLPSKSGFERTRFELLVDGEIKPANAAEREVYDLAQEILRKTNENAVDAGATIKVLRDGKVVIERVARRTTGNRLPRSYGKHWSKVMGTPELRDAFLTEVLNANPDLVEKGFDLEKLTRVFDPAQTAGQISGDVRKASFENSRLIENMPTVWRDYEIFESNPSEIISRMIRREAAQSGSIKEFGPNMTPQERQEFNEREVAAGRLPETRTGIADAVARYKESVTNTQSVQERENIRKMADDWAVMLQGGEPNPPAEWMREAMVVEGARRAFETVKAPVYDVAEPFIRAFSALGPSAIGRTLGKIAQLGGVKAVQDLAILDGIIVAETGSQDFKEAYRGFKGGLWGHIRKKFIQATDAAGYVGRKTERAKTAFHYATTEVLLEKWKNGMVSDLDRVWLRDVLRIPEFEKLLSGKADANLKRQFRLEYVQFMTSRGAPASGSPLGASRAANLFLAYGNYFYRRFNSLAKVYGLLAKAPKMTPGERQAAFGIVARETFGLAMTGMAAQLLTALLVDAFKGEFGLERFWNEIKYDGPAASLASFVSTAALGGPFSVAMELFDNPEKPDTLARLTTPSRLGWEMVRATMGTGPYSEQNFAGKLWTLAQRTNLVPLTREGENAAMAIFGAQSEKDLQSDIRLVRAWMRENNIETPYGERNKEQGYYDAIKAVRRAVRSNLGSPAKALREAAVEIKDALGLAPSDSVSASLLGGQILSRLTPEQRADLDAYMGGDGERMRRLYQYDNSLREVAKVVGRMPGKNPVEDFDTELDRVTEQARLGGKDGWRKLLEPTLEEAALKIAAGQNPGDKLDRIARAMSAFPEQMDGILSERQFKVFSRKSSSDLGIFLQGVLMRRARERAKNKQE